MNFIEYDPTPTITIDYRNCRIGAIPIQNRWGFSVASSPKLDSPWTLNPIMAATSEEVINAGKRFVDEYADFKPYA
jgi:hypothetical protein